MQEYHSPVLLGEVIQWLEIEPDDRLVDMTLGGGGYSLAMLAALGKEGRLVAFDRDIEAVEVAHEGAAKDPRATVHHANFSEAAGYLELHYPDGHDGMVFDLGVSSHQLDTGSRGFSFRQDGPLDMRMNPTGAGPTAADLVAEAPLRELTRIFREYGEEKKARSVALAIVERREQQRFETTLDLASVIEKVVGHQRPERGVPKKHPATRCFQALRIAVNDELGELKKGLVLALETAKPGSRVLVVSYHSLEDRFVKNFFRDAAGRCHCPRHLPICMCGAKATIEIKTRRPVRPGDEEVASNRRARSALLRVAEKI